MTEVTRMRWHAFQNPLPLCAGTGLFSWHPHRICGACTTNIPTFSVDFKSELQYLVKNFQCFSILFLGSFSCPCQKSREEAGKPIVQAV